MDITGHCHCGAITYTISGEMIKQSYCDCRACQLATGALKTPYVTFHQSDVTIAAGGPRIYQGTNGSCDEHGS